MFAVVSFSKQQFRVKAGDFIRVPRQAEKPNELVDVPVLAFGSKEGFAFDKEKLKEAGAKAVILRHLRGRKMLVFKKKRRKGYRRTKGHRQELTEIRITELRSPEGEISKAEIPKKALQIETRKQETASKEGAEKQTAPIAQEDQTTSKEGTEKQTAPVAQKDQTASKEGAEKQA